MTGFLILNTLGESIDVEVVNIKLGDVNGDNDITVEDVTLLQMHLAKLVVLQDEYLAVADSNKDGEVTIEDVTTIQYYIARIIADF